MTDPRTMRSFRALIGGAVIVAAAAAIMVVKPWREPRLDADSRLPAELFAAERATVAAADGCIFADGMAFDSFCSKLASYRQGWNDSGTAGVYTKGGALCYSSSMPAVGTYTYCGGSGGLGGNTWDAARALVALSDHWPGRYSLQRGEQQERRLEAEIAALDNRLRQTMMLTGDARGAVASFVRDAVAPSVRDGAAAARQLESRLDAQLGPILALPSPEPAAPAPAGNTFVGPIAEAERRIDASAHDPRKQWKDLEDVWRLHASGALANDPLARAEVARAYTRYFDDNGVLHAGVVGPSGGFTAALSSQLRTDGHAATGQDVRYELNRALIAYTAAGDDDARWSALGEVALTLGSDFAYAAGDDPAGSDLLRLAATSVDITLGLAPVPLVPSVNDAVQLIHGMVTGRDYTGHPMSSADYALRGVGVVLGFCGGECSTVGKKAVTIAGKVVTRAFYRGAALVRDLRLGAYVADALKPVRTSIDEFATIVGAAYSKYTDFSNWGGDTATRVGREISAIADTAAHSSSWERCAAEDVNRELAAGNPKFKPSYMEGTETFTLTLQRDQKVFRVHSDANQMGSWVMNFDPRGLSPVELADALSLPNGPQGIKWISVFEVPSGTVMRGGRAAGIPKISAGGAYQWEVLPKVQPDWLMRKVPFGYSGPL